MLRQTLCRWLERKPARPVMSRAGRSLSATKAAAAGLAPPLSSSSASPGYSTGDSDLRDAAATLDVVDDVPIEPFSRPVRTSAAASGAAAARNANAQEMLSHLKHKYDFPPARDDTPHAANTQQRPPMKSARHVMSTLRRPHAASSSTAAAAAPAVDEADTDDAAASVDDADVGDVGGEGLDDAADDEGGGGDTGDGAHPSAGEAEAHGDDGASTTATAAAATSSDAYRFLLNHIDAEIAALQRRHTAVTTRRQGVQTAQTQRVKELFELIEAPWSLLPTAMQPALPATGVDVFIKEQQLARQQRTTAGGDGQDKMYVLALHKNYKSMPAGRKRFYEEAAQHNAAVREEMKYQLTRGCARFEAFLENVKECTMVMAREGQVPELPSGHTHQHQQHHNRFQRPQRPAAAPAAVVGSGEAAKATAEAVESMADTASTAKTGPSRAARRIKNAAAAAKASKTDRASPKKTAGNGASKAGKSSRAAPKPKAKQAKSPAKLTTKASSSKKTTAAAASPAAAKAGPSRSIPLPNLNNLALKKIKQLSAPPGKKTKAGKATKGKASAAGGGRKKKK